MSADESFNILMPFWIDTDGYTDRDREMFVCGVEFMRIYDLVKQRKGVFQPIHRENASRVRMLCGQLQVPCTITPHGGYDGCETWAELEIPDT